MTAGPWAERLTATGADPAAVRRLLTENSGLPGPRGNLELADAFAAWAPDELVETLAPESPAMSGATEPEAEYIDLCRAIALGERLSRGPDPQVVARLHASARDPRWRIREGVARGLQRLGDRDPERLAQIVTDWASDSDPLVERAAVAAICEPRLLRTSEAAALARTVCRVATDRIIGTAARERRDPDLRVLRQALGYAWSVAVAADPEPGLVAFAELERIDDPDVAWVVRENRRKSRLRRLLAEPG